jgi:hypothetical protein
MLALFSLLSLTNALAWISFAPISYHTGSPPLLPPFHSFCTLAPWAHILTYSGLSRVCSRVLPDTGALGERAGDGLHAGLHRGRVGGRLGHREERPAIRRTCCAPPPQICVCARVTHLGGNRWWPAAS